MVTLDFGKCSGKRSSLSSLTSFLLGILLSLCRPSALWAKAPKFGNARVPPTVANEDAHFFAAPFKEQDSSENGINQSSVKAG